MSLRRKGWIFIVAAISFSLVAVILLTVARVGQEQPVAPTVPQSQPRAVGGSPVPACILTFTIVQPSPTPTPTPTPTPSPTHIPTPTPMSSPTPSPAPVAQCVAVRMYQVVSGSWILVQNLSSLHPGDTIYIAVLGDATGGTFDMARFRVNGLPPTWAQSVLVNPFGEFYYQHTLLPGVTSYTIEAEIHHLTLGWR